MAENEHDENLIDDIMRGGPNYCLDRIESLETEVSRLQARVAELEADLLQKEAPR
jgi:outer membrane murein-binding lipoprotein Lpp